MSKYSTKIADAIQEFLHDDDWHYTFREEKGTFHFSLSTHSRLNTVDYFIAVREDHYRVLCVSPLSVNTDDAQELARMAEFITRANYGMTRGCFEMDYRDGEIRFRMTVDCDGDAVPTQEIVKNSVYVPASMFNRYGSGMAHTMFSDLNPAAIVRACEAEDSVEALRSLLHAAEDSEQQDDLDDIDGALFDSIADLFDDDDDDEDSADE